MADVDEFRAWAADMNARNKEREAARVNTLRAQSYHERKQGCGAMLGMFKPIGAIFTRPSTLHDYFGRMVLCNKCFERAAGADYIVSTPIEMLKCGDWVDLSDKGQFTLGTEPPLT